MTGTKAPFTYHGGKQKHVGFLTQHMPPVDDDTIHMVDVFGGSGAVIINAPEYHQKTYNDINVDVVNFFTILRNNPDPLIRAIALTPYARDELDEASYDSIDPIEQARRFFVRSRQSRNGTTYRANRSTWRRVTRSKTFKSIGKTWSETPELLAEIAERFASITVENQDACAVIVDYDSPTTFFYCDPPYVISTRTGGKAYQYEYSEDQHRTLAHTLKGIKGKAMVSGYRSDLYNEIFDGWIRIDDDPKYAYSAHAMRTESIWINYTPEAGLYGFDVTSNP